MKVLPWSGTLSTLTAPPSRCAISRVMDRPSPVPPYLRLVVPSACWNAPKMVSRCCSGIPIPVSRTRKATTAPWPRTPAGTSSSAAGSMRSSTLPRSVNFTAFDSRLRSTCRSRESSVSRSAGAPGAVVTVKSRLFCIVIGRKVASTYSMSRFSSTRSGLMSIFPASTLDRSRMSLISCSRSEPAEWMICAYSTCFGVRLREGFCASNCARISRLLSGVRSSWLMLARNSDLYFDASDSCCARVSSSCRACSIWRFFASMSRFCATSSDAFSSNSALERCSSSCCTCSSADRSCSAPVSRCDSASSSSVRALATMVLTLTPTVSISCARKSWWIWVNGVTEASSMTPRT